MNCLRDLVVKGRGEMVRKGLHSRAWDVVHEEVINQLSSHGLVGPPYHRDALLWVAGGRRLTLDTVIHYFHHRKLWVWCCFVRWGCWVGVFRLLLHVADPSLPSSCLPMTTLAQLHDCHSCNDERSIVQKKSSCTTESSRER